MEEQRARRDPVEVTLEDLERDRLTTYLDWAEVRTPVWFWPTYAAGISAWVASFDLGRGFGMVGAALIVLAAVMAIRTMATRSGVSTPRFREMPAQLRRAFIPTGIGALLLVIIVGLGATDVALPYVVLGVVVGPLVASCGAWSSWWYRSAAARLAAQAAIDR